MRTLTLIILSLVIPVSLQADEAAKEVKKITFDEHIKPIFREHCTACHSESDKESDLALDTYGATLTGGSSGEVIEAGNASSSRLYALITHAERPYMPPDQDPIAKEQLDLVKTWIEQGMPENAGSKIKKFNTAAAAMLDTANLGKPEGPPPMPEMVLRQAITETPRSAAISAMVASPWAPLIAVGGQQQVSLYHTESGELLGVIPFPEGVPQSITFTRDGKQILVGGGRHSHSGCAVLVDIATGERIAKVGDELDIVMAADITADKTRIALAGPQKIVRVFDTLSGEKLFEMKKHTDWIFALRYSPDGVLLASGDRSNGLIVWEADTGNLYSELTGHRGEIRSLDFRADSNVLASASLDGTIKLWDMFESKEIKSWNAHGGGATAVAYSNNGLIASAGRDARIKLWDGNGALKNQFQGLSAAAMEVALTGDAAVVAGGDWNGQIQMWSVADPKQTKLVAANPPSIETRLQLANEHLAAVKQEFTGVEQKTAAAKTAASAAKQRLEQAASSSKEVENLLAETESRKSTLANQVADFDAKIQELEKQLVALRTQRQGAAGQLTQTSTQLEELKVRSQSSAEELTQATQQHAELARVATETATLLEAAQAKLAEAEQAAQKALADKQALDARAALLAQKAATAEAASKELESQVTQAVEAQSTVETSAQQANAQLAALQAQLDEMQKKIAAASEAYSQAQADLDAKKQVASELQQKLESAQQEALGAKEKLELFQKSYQKPEIQ